MSAMNKEMMDELDRFFAGKVITDVNRDTFLVCNLEDSNYKLTLSLVFMRDWDSIESNDYNYVGIYRKGAVFTIPCYWVSIPKQLAIPYIQSIIEKFYNEEVATWGLGYTPDYDYGEINTGCCCSPNFTSGGGAQPPCGIKV